MASSYGGSRSHSDIPQSVGVLWMSSQPDALCSTWQHTTLTTDKSSYKVYAYIVKHNCILGRMLFTICKAQLHVSATDVGHLQVVQWKCINRLYTYHNRQTFMLTEGFEPGNPRKRAAADLCLRPRGLRDWPVHKIKVTFSICYIRGAHIFKSSRSHLKTLGARLWRQAITVPRIE
jgi:hypothetical protein